jgi:phosphoglycolate phosphatase
MAPMTNAVLFDLDGTLVDSRADLALGVNLTRRELGLPPLAEDAVTSFVGDGVRTLLRRALPEAPQALEEALGIFGRHYGAHLLDRTRLYPGVAEAMASLAGAGFRLGLVTNKSREFTLPVLEGLGIAHRFAAIVAGGEGGALKPDPRPLAAALAMAGARADGSWMAGDHVTDLEAGRRAGLRRCWCRYGFGDPRGETWDLAVDDLPALARYLLECQQKD